MIGLSTIPCILWNIFLYVVEKTLKFHAEVDDLSFLAVAMFLLMLSTVIIHKNTYNYENSLYDNPMRAFLRGRGVVFPDEQDQEPEIYIPEPKLRITPNGAEIIYWNPVECDLE
ncbi:hypothetical protein HEP_00180500 [Hepatocystis sp. ex Piliocolobus tephrosceles]|nr:hypothetical protein HEP_00180500 [Hepatocystis sp. ex Piliocolobus tephrosceles]